jgi:hypothetical protein
MVPFALITGFIAAAALAADPLYGVMVLAALGLTLMALVGYRRERSHRRPGLCGIPYYFLSMNLALALGAIRFLRGSQSVAWKPTTRHVAEVAKEKGTAVA